MKDMKEYLYNFVGGGWNSEYATTKGEAIKQAKARWKGNKGLIVDEKSFRVSSSSESIALMSLFY